MIRINDAGKGRLLAHVISHSAVAFFPALLFALFFAQTRDFGRAFFNYCNDFVFILFLPLFSLMHNESLLIFCSYVIRLFFLLFILYNQIARNRIRYYMYNGLLTFASLLLAHFVFY